MTILVVDDQPQVVSSIIRGVHWKKCGIQKVLTAYNVAEAKKAIQNSEINILLCDVEMPVENGFDLITWLNDKYNIAFIFLTAHSDFEYVQKAIQMGGVDYILQPAPYHVIEASIATAVDKVNKNAEAMNSNAYKDIFLRNSETLLHSLLADWVKGEYLTPDYFITDMNKLGENFSRDSVFYCSYICCQYNEAGDYVNTDVILNSIITEEFEENMYHLILIPYDMLHFALLLHSKAPEDKDIIYLHSHLNRLIESMQKNYDCIVSIQHSDEFVEINTVPKVFRELRSKSQPYTQAVTQPNTKPGKKELPGDSDLTLTCAHSNITNIIKELNFMLQNNNQNPDALNHHYLDLMQALCLISNRKNCSVFDLYNADSKLEKLFEMRTNTVSMLELASVIAEYLQEFIDSTAVKGSQQNQIATITQYIRNNIEKDLRRSDIADAVYLNPNYLSTMFKENMNVSLKEYIIMEKMKLARTLLRTTELPISIVAAKIGYTNFSHFSQTYKKFWGTPPTAERAK
jgi:two-component system, response regulator YesN